MISFPIRVGRYSECRRCKPLSAHEGRSSVPARPTSKQRARQGSRAPQYRACPQRTHASRLPAFSEPPSARAARVQRPEGPRLPAQTTHASRLPAFGEPPSARAARVQRPEGPRLPAQTTHASRLPAFGEPPSARAARAQGPLSTAPASTKDACVAPASVWQAPQRACGKGPGALTEKSL